MAGDQEMFLQAVMDDSVAKPVEPQDLLEVLTRNLA
jgi:CheY-like chemotaxis protein